MTEYEKYQLKWMIDNGYSIRDMITRIGKVAWEELTNDGGLSYDKIIDEAFEIFEEEQGFENGQIWDSEDKWEGRLIDADEFIAELKEKQKNTNHEMKQIEKNEPQTLCEFLNHFDFDYEIQSDENGAYFHLVDCQGANFGDIESDQFELSSDGLDAVIDRLDSYYKDYVFDGLAESLEEKYHIDINPYKRDDQNKIYTIIKELGLPWDMDVLPYICGDEHLIFDSLEELKERCDNIQITELEKITPRKNENSEKVLDSNIGMKQYQQIKSTKASELNKNKDKNEIKK